MFSYDDVASIGPYIIPFFTLSYPTDPPAKPDSFHDSTYYKTGALDICFVIGCIAVMAVVRDALRIFLLEPFAHNKLMKDYEARTKKKQQNGITNDNGHANGNGHAAPRSHRRELRKIHRSVLRFAEQGYQLVYYTGICAFGIYVHINVPTSFFDLTDVWVNYPHSLSGPLKFYYLLETAFYVHQMLILNAEARRKDHWQMMAHHIITVFLMATSYRYNFTRVGCVIMVLMDWCDVFLPLAKMLRYLEVAQMLCDSIFAFFMVSWFVTRHVLFIVVIVSAVCDTSRLADFKWEPENGRFMSYPTHITFCICLITLQVLQIIWFTVICRVAYRVVIGEGASDSRSDDENLGESESDKDK